MSKMFVDTAQDPNTWSEAYKTRTADWDQIFQNYDAAVDWPSAEFYPELIKQYPDAKVILTDRDPEAWYKSVNNSIMHFMKSKDMAVPGRAIELREMCKLMILNGVFEGRWEDQEFAMSKMVENSEHAKRIVPADQLLVLKATDGWGPLCKFLGVPVPDEAYPHSNKSADFGDKLADLKNKQDPEQSA